MDLKLIFLFTTGGTAMKSFSSRYKSLNHFLVMAQLILPFLFSGAAQDVSLNGAKSL